MTQSTIQPYKIIFPQIYEKVYLVTCPGLIEDAINKHLEITPATALGHINKKI